MALYELRTYTLHVGKMAEVVKLYSEEGYPGTREGRTIQESRRALPGPASVMTAWHDCAPRSEADHQPPSDPTRGHLALRVRRPLGRKGLPHAQRELAFGD